MSVGSVFQPVLVRYVLAQAALVPLMLLSWLFLPKRASLRFQWALHRVLVVLALVLPILLALPVSSRIVHAFSDVALQPSATTPASVEPAVAAPGEPLPFSPPLPVDAAPVGEAQSVPLERVAEAGRPASTFADALNLLHPLFAAFSALGAGIFLAGIGRQAVRERTLLRSATMIRRIGRVRVVVSDMVRSPFSTGLMRPRIYLPTGIARSERARRMVLAHESLHVRHAHITWTFLERLHAALLWYNPLAHLAATNGARLRELVCDRGAGRIHGDTAYCRVLLDAAASLVGERTAPGLANGWIGRRFLRRRIEFLTLGLGKTSHGWVYAAAPVAAFLSLAVIIGCGPRVLPEPAADEPAAASTETPSYTSLSHIEGAWPGGTPFRIEGPFPAYRDAVVDTAATGWNLGTGRLYNLWAGPERKLVLGVNNPEGFWFTTTSGDGVEATAFNEDIHAVISGLLLHLPFLQRIWAGLRTEDPRLEGDTGFVLSVNADGAVTKAEPDPAKPGNAKLAKAYAASMEGWKLTTHPLASAYRMRIPITSFLRQYPPNGYRVMSVRLGDPVAEVREGGMSVSFLPGLDAAAMSGVWDDDLQDADGSLLLAGTIRPDGIMRDVQVLDRDGIDEPMAAHMAENVRSWPAVVRLPFDREITLVLLFSRIPIVADAGIRAWELRREAYSVDRYGTPSFDSLADGFSGRIKLELPPSGSILTMGSWISE